MENADPEREVAVTALPGCTSQTYPETVSFLSKGYLVPNRWAPFV